MVLRLDRQKARTDPEQRRFYLQLMRNTAEATIDSQGRISRTRLAVAVTAAAP